MPFWIASIIFALDGEAPEWGTLILFMFSAIVVQATAEFANTYIDRHEDQIYVPSNPLVTGELKEGTAKKALILENTLEGSLLVALLLVTLDYYLIITMAVIWFVGLAYSLPPFKFKETLAGPFSFALPTALIPIAAYLLVGTLDNFVMAFAALLFVGTLGANISTGQLRKTAEALTHGLIKVEESSSISNLKTIGLGLKVKTAMVSEAVASLTAFILVGIFWYLDIFPMILSIALLASSLPFALLTIAFRIKDPVGNAQKCVQFAGMAALFTMLSFFSVALIDVLHWHWGFAILACIVFLTGFALLFKQVRPYRPAYHAQQV